MDDKRRVVQTMLFVSKYNIPFGLNIFYFKSDWGTGLAYINPSRKKNTNKSTNTKAVVVQKDD